MEQTIRQTVLGRMVLASEAALAHFTPDLCRAARALLNWSVVRLASKAGLNDCTVRDFENGRRTPSDAKLLRIREVLEGAGVRFVADELQIVEGPSARPKQSSLEEGEAGIIANSGA